ncbi:MAG: hypothetical protein KJ789_12260 [Alphaproteobacteria bacterium]|nr:hypothetical protein [Alphaproteobacteria bacterium]
MIADSSAWIELLRGTGSAADLRLRQALARGARLLMLYPVYQEVLQGAANPQKFMQLQGQLDQVPRYEPDVQNENDITPGAYGRGEAEGRAADACSWAVEGEMGDDARVDSITGTEANNGGWYVTGTASRLGGEVRSFGCSYRGGRVVDVNFS